MAEMYPWKEYSARISLEQRLRQRTQSQRRRVRFFRSVLIFAIGLTNLRKLERSVRSGSVSFYNFIGIEVRTWQPNPKTISSVPSLSSLFSSRFFSNWTSNFHFFKSDGFMHPSQTLKHEIYRCSQVWPTILTYGFIAVVKRLRLTTGWCRSSLFLSHSVSLLCLCSRFYSFPGR